MQDYCGIVNQLTSAPCDAAFNGVSMKSKSVFCLIVIALIFRATTLFAQPQIETPAQRDARMQWWREARFGMFIHWGLYSILAGEWKGETNHAEWIRTTAQIPLEEYDKLVARFNPVQFDAEAWVQMAKDAGMKYLVITSKHHDGFCLFDSKHTDFDVMATPFQRDILKELAAACRKAGLKMCWYHSIMDWHHPDYLPRREWEKTRSTEGAELDRYIAHMKAQLKEIVTNYGDIGVLWFDGEWESTWNNQRGRDLYDYVRSLQPNIIINNRVGASRAGMEGFDKGEGVGDFGTPEQQVPATGLPGVDWESCITMNNNWGYNRHDQNWKSSTELLRMLADIASKGGNLLLNIGPTAEGLFPQASVERLREIGNWMRVNSEAIYGTHASPFKQLAWGRCTQKSIEGGTRLYLHVFDWPANGSLRVPGVFNQTQKAFLLVDKEKTALAIKREEDALLISVPPQAPDAHNSIVVLDIVGAPDVNHPPEIVSENNIFVDQIEVAIKIASAKSDVRYTRDGSEPTAMSPRAQGLLMLKESTTIAARGFRAGQPISATVRATFTKVTPRPALQIEQPQPGMRYSYFEGEWNNLPDFKTLAPVQSGVYANFDLSPRKEVERFGFEYTGYIRVPETGVYAFFTESDDGSRLYIGEELIVDNDGLHSMIEKRGVIALAAGLHPIRVTFFEKTGGDGLKVYYKMEKSAKQPVPAAWLFY